MDTFVNKDFDGKLTIRDKTLEANKKIVITPPKPKNSNEQISGKDIRNNITAELNAKYKK